MSDSEKTKFKKNILISGGSRGIGKSAAYLLRQSDYQVLAPSSQELDQSSAKSVQDYFLRNFQGHENDENAEKDDENAEIEDCEQYLEGTAHNRTSSRLRRTNDRSVLQVHEDHEDNENAEIEDCEQSLYGLIVNAGVYHSSCFEEYCFNDWLRVLDVNLNGAFHLVKAALPLLKNYVELNPESYSRIIFISSVSAYAGELYAPAYSASKAALIALAKSLALEFAKYKITVNSICPGWVKTDMALNQMPNEDSVKDSLGATLQNRWIEPEEIAHAISYLLSEPAKGITGQQLNITAGLDI
ncbi:MAG: SDR family NAD(P)-dependent oxidoreductase [Vampirovibrionia bacterium]